MRRSSLHLLFVVASLGVLSSLPSLSAAQGISHSVKRFCERLSRKIRGNNKNMGQAVRMFQYDRAANERNAVRGLNLLNQELSWYRLDDGVMGGRSESNHVVSVDNQALHFKGTINTNGGGFCSIRSRLPTGFPPSGAVGLRLDLTGDGKTYKLLLHDGSRSTFGPTRRSPSWQMDLPTKKGVRQEDVIIPFDSLCPSWGGGPGSQPSAHEKAQVSFQADQIKEIGFMLSLRLSDGSPNPVETFGKGIFPFSLQIHSIEVVEKSSSAGSEDDSKR